MNGMKRSAIAAPLVCFALLVATATVGAATITQTFVVPISSPTIRSSFLAMTSSPPLRLGRRTCRTALVRSTRRPPAPR